MLAMAATTAIFTTSCENDNINPYDYANNGNNQETNGGINMKMEHIQKMNSLQ